MELNLSPEQKDALKRVLYSHMDANSNMMNAVYIPPAAQLRNRANEIEQNERDLPLLREIQKLLA